MGQAGVHNHLRLLQKEIKSNMEVHRIRATRLDVDDPIWNQVSHILYECGVSDKLNWKQALIGCKGRMNPALYKTWHTIRAYVLAAIWEARNARVHTSVNRISQFSREKIKGMVIEACKLAEFGTSKASKATAILLRKKVVKLKK